MTFDDVQYLLDILPKEVVEKISTPENLIEIVLDVGRPLEVRYSDHTFEYLEDHIISQETIDEITSKLGTFGQDNRVGIDGTLHRISRVQNRHEDCIGLTCRVGKPFYGSVQQVKDLIDRGANVLILGKPGAGKTTILRDVSNYLSTTATKRVVIIDTSNEIAGDGNIPHPAVGRSRRLQVPFNKTQHLLMIEAVENHTPEVIIIDEISQLQEAQAAKTIAQRGVQLIATAHGKKLEDVINNPPLSELVGGVNIVTLSDEVARQRSLNSKTVQERKTEPIFDVIVEIDSYNDIFVHHSTRDSVDAILSGGICYPELRRIADDIVKIITPYKVSFPIRIDSTISKPTTNGHSKSLKLKSNA